MTPCGMLLVRWVPSMLHCVTFVVCNLFLFCCADATNGLLPCCHGIDVQRCHQDAAATLCIPAMETSQQVGCSKYTLQKRQAADKSV